MQTSFPSAGCTAKRWDRFLLNLIPSVCALESKILALSFSFPSRSLSRSGKMIKEWKWVKGEMDNEIWPRGEHGRMGYLRLANLGTPPQLGRLPEKCRFGILRLLIRTDNSAQY